jgi:hypothetical protein
MAYQKNDGTWIFERTAFRELMQAYTRLVKTDSATALIHRADIRFLNLLSTVVPALRSEEYLPDWENFKYAISRLGGDVFTFETLYRRAGAALNDPRACPRCGLEQIAPVSTVHDLGTTDINSSGFGAGLAGGNTVIVRTMQSGTERTRLASALRPYPDQEGGAVLLAWCSIFFLLPGIIGAVAAASQAAGIVVVLSLCWAAIGAIGAGIGASKSAKLGRIERGKSAALEIWTQAWYCLNCEGTFFNFGHAPNGIKERKVVGTADFRQTVWSAGGYADLG